MGKFNPKKAQTGTELENKNAPESLETVVDSTSTDSVGSTADSDKASKSDAIADAISNNTKGDTQSKGGKKFAARNKGKVGHSKPMNNKRASEKTTNTSPQMKNSASPVSSTGLRTVENKYSNFDQSLAASYYTAGWNEINDTNSIFNAMNSMMNTLALNSHLLDKRGELLANFSAWTDLLKARPNGAPVVYVADHKNSDKSISSETIFQEVYKQRRPFEKRVQGVPLVSSTRFPDVMYNLSFLDISTNGHTQGITEDILRYTSYGKLTQDLTQNYGYQTRNISIDGTPVRSYNNQKLGWRINSKNTNYIGKGIANFADGNELVPYGIKMSNASDTDLNMYGIKGGLGVSVELLNKTKHIRQLFDDIKLEASKYSEKAGSGDNAWFNGASLLLDEETLAVTLNSVADLKTFLYIMNDAIDSAFGSQAMKAIKLGTPDSTYIGLTSKSTFLRKEYTNWFNRLWSYLTPLPMHKDVIEKWNQYKTWSKISDHELTAVDNILQIPFFNIVRSGGGYYGKDDLISWDQISGDKTITPFIDPTNKNHHAMKHLTYTAQLLDRSKMTFPMGDWYAYFLQNYIIGLGASSFVRFSKSNRPIASEFNYVANQKPLDDPLKTSTLILDGDEFTDKYIRMIDDLSNANIYDSAFDIIGKTPKNAITYQMDQNNNYQTTTIPSTADNSALDPQVSDMIKNHNGNTNLWFDMTISAHTVTGFMMAFMDLIVTCNSNGMLNAMATAAQAVTPYFARLATLSKGESFIFGTPIKNIDISFPNKEVQSPVHSSELNQVYHYPTMAFHDNSGVSWYPTRYNAINLTEIEPYEATLYKLSGLRHSMVDKSGKMDRDIYADNTMCTILTNSATKDIWGQHTVAAITYLNSHTIIRPNVYTPFECTFGGNNNMFPVYIGEHASSMFGNLQHGSTNIYMSGSTYIPVEQLVNRSLTVNTSDELYQSPFPLFMSLGVSGQIMADAFRFIEYTQCPLLTSPIVSTKWLNHDVINSFSSINIMSIYNNNTHTQIVDEIVERNTSRWDINSPAIPSTKFTLI